MKTCLKCRVCKPVTDFYKKAVNPDGLQPWCKACCKAQNDSYFKRYYHTNPEKMRERRLLQRDLYPGAVSASRARRAERKKQLPNTWNDLSWQICLAYFENTCAVCNYPLKDVLNTAEPHADHWIPLNYQGEDNPGTVPTNMICLCNSCNSSKCDRMPEEWLINRYGKSRASKVLRRVEEYFASVKYFQAIADIEREAVDKTHITMLQAFEPTEQIQMGRYNSMEIFSIYGFQFRVCEEWLEMIENAEQKIIDFAKSANRYSVNLMYRAIHQVLQLRGMELATPFEWVDWILNDA